MPKRSCSEMVGNDWNLHTDDIAGGGYTVTTDRIQAVLLWEILQELKRLNRLLHCSNFVNMPRELRGLRRDLKATRKAS